MDALVFKVTTAGRAALVNAKNNGTNTVLVAAVGVTDQAFVAADTTAVLPGERKRLTTFSGAAVASNTIHVTIRDDTADVYTVRGFALYLDDGTLFGSYGQADPIGEKSAQSMFLLATDIIFADIDATQLTFGDTNFLLASATTEQQGILELATDAETTTGTDAVRAVVPKGLKAALDARFGAGAPSGFVKGLLTAATAALFRTALAIKGAALYDTGTGNGLDADLLDGQHGAYYRAWANLTDVPASFPPSAHTHAWVDITGAPAYATRWATWDEVTGKPATFPPAPHSQDWSTILNIPVTASRWPAWGEVTGKPAFGTAALTNVEAYATAAQGVKADNSLQDKLGYATNADANALTASGMFGYTSAAMNTPHNEWATLLSVAPMPGGDRAFQLAFSWNFDDYAIRSVSSGTWKPWRFLWHTGNFDPSQYAKLSGATFTGPIAATNLSGINTGDQDLSPYAKLSGATFTGIVKAPSFDTGSDPRLKDHLRRQTIPSNVDGIGLWTWDWNAFSKLKGAGAGVRSDEVRPVFPHCVHVDEDGFDAVDYGKLGVHLGVVAQRRIRAAEARADGLARTLAELTDRLAQLERTVAQPRPQGMPPL